MHICFVAEGYPTQEDPFMTFVRELIVQIAMEGEKCTVIAPQSISRAVRQRVPTRPFVWKDKYDAKNTLIVYQPPYVSFSGFLRSVVNKQIIKATRRAIQKVNKQEPIDILYAHFWHMAVIAAEADAKLPIIVASGEDIPTVKERFPNAYVDNMLKKVRGVIYVAQNSYEKSKRLKLQSTQPYIIEPNGYNPLEFKPLDRKQCRADLGWNQDDFIISFIGSFDKRKGVDRLSTALKSVNQDGSVKSCFIGTGKIQPKCPGILFAGKLGHSEIAKYLCASDAFVLPTNSEGCCNAIIEALGCGLPIISSDLPFNEYILDEECSIRIDTNDVNQIITAIKKLRDDNELRKELAEGALRKASTLTIGTRAKSILNFIKSVGL